MSEYGVTDKGFVRKRYDTIYEELQNDIKDGLGIDISINPKSFFNVLISSFADKIATAWELAEQTYYAHYPATAEGINLDYACQFGGTIREEGARTKYSILCSGTDGTSIPAGTRIASTTSPQVYFATLEDNTISRSSCNSVVIRVMQVAGEGHYTVWLNDTAYTYLSQTEDDKMAILEGLRSSITDNDFTVSINTDDEFLVIQSKNKYLSHSIDMTENLSTEEVTSIIIFESEEYKRIQLTEGAITEIITSTAGFSRCTNLAIPVYGRERETDAELRQSYARKQSYRSSTLLESITSAIMNNVAEISSAVAFENDTDLTDSEGRPPHSIEVVADGGDEAAIAQQILLYKAAGIQTFGKEVVDVPTSFGTTVAVRFNRPVPVYVWLKVSVVKNPEEAMPPNYEELIKSAIMSYAENIRAGENIVIQKVITPINTLVSGLAYISIKAYTSQDIEAKPTDTDYNLTYITVASREKAYFDEERIEVVVDEN